MCVSMYVHTCNAMYLTTCTRNYAMTQEMYHLQLRATQGLHTKPTSSSFMPSSRMDLLNF